MLEYARIARQENKHTTMQECLLHIHRYTYTYIGAYAHKMHSQVDAQMYLSRPRKEGIPWPGFIVETQSRLTWAGAVPPVPEASEALHVN